MTVRKKSLAESFPSIAAEWDADRNGVLTPDSVTAGSNKKAWWICKEGHSYECAIDHRTTRNQGCPFCSGKRILSGYNDLRTRNPELAQEWDDEKNGEVTPDSISLNSHKKFWWKCHICQHEWQATPNDRARGRNCPICAKQIRSAARSRTILKDRADSILAKNEKLLEEWDYDLNTIDPGEVLIGSHVKVWWKCSICGNSWSATIGNRVRGSGCPKCMKHMRTSFPEQAIYYYLKQAYPLVYNGYTDVFENRMELDIFIPSIMTGIEYDGVAFHKGKSAASKMEMKYRLCREKGIRLIRVSELDNESEYCDICLLRSGHTDYDLVCVINDLLKKLNLCEIDVDVVRDRALIMNQYVTSIREKSISSRYPELVKKWDAEKNGGLKPEQVNAFSNKKYWWRCSLGHSYQTTPIIEACDTKTCPICSNHRLLVGFNDLASRLPQLASEWDYEKNAPITPTDVIYSSNNKYWWICPEGHHYEACLANRYREKSGCPYCSNRMVLSGYNDLKTIRPELMKEWNYRKNTDIQPEGLLPGSNRKVWWICECGHEWEATVNSRACKKHSAGCPYCTNRKVLTGFNDLATKRPELLIEWDCEKNAGIDPAGVSIGSNLKVWWKCKDCGNEWQTMVVSRTCGQKTGCPKCGYKTRMQKTRAARIKREKKDLCTLFPEIAKEWDYEKNTCDPTEISPGANIKVWWICSKGHSYQSWLTDRTGKHKTGCPYCAKKRKLSNM